MSIANNITSSMLAEYKIFTVIMNTNIFPYFWTIYEEKKKIFAIYFQYLVLQSHAVEKYVLKLWLEF